MSILEVKNLTKKFGDFTAVDDVSFNLQEGEILGLLGPNGAGKTTVIQMLLAILKETSGDIRYFGKSLAKEREEILEYLNFSSTYTNLPWDLKVKECLHYTSYFYKIKDRKKRVEKIKNTFKLEKLMNMYIKELSEGQKTRVNLAKSFINFPKVLLLDEPTASLDPDVANRIRKLLIKQRNEFQTSIIITSHNMAEVEEMCDRVIFINNGKIVANSTPAELASRIKKSHLKILSTKNLSGIEKIANDFKYGNHINGKFITINLPEMEVANFLNKVAVENFTYEEISIKRPTLEDYFLEMSEKNDETE